MEKNSDEDLLFIDVYWIFKRYFIHRLLTVVLRGSRCVEIWFCNLK